MKKISSLVNFSLVFTVTWFYLFGEIEWRDKEETHHRICWTCVLLEGMHKRDKGAANLGSLVRRKNTKEARGLEREVERKFWEMKCNLGDFSTGWPCPSLWLSLPCQGRGDFPFLPFLLCGLSLQRLALTPPSERGEHWSQLAPHRFLATHPDASQCLINGGENCASRNQIMKFTRCSEFRERQELQGLVYGRGHKLTASELCVTPAYIVF